MRVTVGLTRATTNDLKVIGCYIRDKSYLFTLSGDCPPTVLFEVRAREDDVDVLMAIVQVESWDTEGTLLAYAIWLDREKFWGKPHDLFVDPYVCVTPLTMRGLERYMESEGKQGISHVLHTTQHIYVATRLSYKARKSYNPWVCYLLDINGSEYHIVHDAASLEDMQAWLIGVEPRSRREIMEWNAGGRKIYNLLNYGIIADGMTDDTNKVIRVLDMADRGDIVYLPAEYRMKVRSNVVLPKGVVIDIRDDQFVTDGVSS